MSDRSYAIPLLYHQRDLVLGLVNEISFCVWALKVVASRVHQHVASCSDVSDLRAQIALHAMEGKLGILGRDRSSDISRGIHAVIQQQDHIVALLVKRPPDIVKLQRSASSAAAR